MSEQPVPEDRPKSAPPAPANPRPTVTSVGRLVSQKYIYQ